MGILGILGCIVLAIGAVLFGLLCVGFVCGIMAAAVAQTVFEAIFE